MKIDWRVVLRDALGVLLLAYLGLLVGGAIDGGDSGRGIPGAVAIGALTAGFCVSGCLAKQARFKHLAVVAACVWVIGTITSSISAGWSFVPSLSDIGLIAASMLLGGLISLAIVKPPPAAPPPDSPPPAAPPSA